MIITRTPFRISFFGGGSDYPVWFKEHEGSVLSTSINKYCYITCRELPPFFEHTHRIVYSKIENAKTIQEIEHPAVRAILEWSEYPNGLEIHHDGDLPARSGLGSSSAFSVGLLHAIYALKGMMVSQVRLAREAIHIEQVLLKEHVGSQDQVATALGGFNKLSFRRDGIFTASPIILMSNRLKEFHSHLMLFFTGTSRIASEIAESKIRNLAYRNNEVNRLVAQVDEAISILTNTSAPIRMIGELLDEAWARKKALSSKVSNPEIDQIYHLAKQSGAIGGKILGAGGGGFLMLFVPPEFHEKIKRKLSKLVHVPFEFENTGTKVVLYQPNGL